jgi:hypothetical protein
MTRVFTLPDGRTIHIGPEDDDQFIAWIDGHEDEPVIGWPLGGLIAEAAGLRPGYAELPDWLDTFTEHVVAELQV